VHPAALAAGTLPQYNAIVTSTETYAVMIIIEFIQKGEFHPITSHEGKPEEK
jgi:hypothetical protein